MCGLSGFITYSEIDYNSRKVMLRKMGAYQVHRGPDSWGEMFMTKAALGHNRLSILDIEGGVQPMKSFNDTYTIIFNGEIYNHLSLRNQLIKLGYSFRTNHSDTETILVGYQHWGKSLFEKLEGMFAIAIWDNENEEIVLARDTFGIKPLYYSFLAEWGLIFSSESKAILSAELFKPELNQYAIIEYFHFRGPVHPNTLIKQISKLDPGHFLKWSVRDENFVIQRYSKDSNWGDNRLKDRRVEMDKLKSLLTESVKSQLVADVPVGLFLSGGVDSSTLCAISKDIDTLQTFNIGTDSKLDESPYARLVAEKLKLPLYTLFINEGDFIKSIKDWIYFNDDPVSDPSALALMLLSAEVKKNNIKVVLSGEGSDELFLGYYSYLKFKVVRKIAKYIPNFILRWVCLRIGQAKLLDYLDDASSPFLGTAHLTSYMQKYKIIEPRSHHFIEKFKIDIETRFSAAKFKSEKGPLLIDQEIRLPNDILARTDRATMAHSIEARVPFLDTEVARFANSLSNKHLVSIWLLRGKAILKELAATMLPKSIIYRRKRGFDLPIAQWLNVSFKDVAYQFISERRIDIINYAEVQKCFERGITGKDAGMIWAWIVLEFWFRAWLSNISSVKSGQVDLEEYFNPQENHVRS
ncbi:MAG: asparagine synthase (glutamine-hydrolyzing) [Cyclobacteriaceae bacterium]|nr:asparagine synthase (glutamine-hydrolyzing) [Cyclobacteriaceae bacterium]